MLESGLLLEANLKIESLKSVIRILENRLDESRKDISILENEFDNFSDEVENDYIVSDQRLQAIFALARSINEILPNDKVMIETCAECGECLNLIFQNASMPIGNHLLNCEFYS